MITALSLLAAYLLGAIPFGLILARATCGIDIRQLGSGNIGATNVVRTVGWKLGIPVLLLDAAKGFFPTFLIPHWLHNQNCIIAISASITYIPHA